ncbi:MAG: RNA polymerase sigma factor [Eubacteriales bacterium]|nr:RNA polymerase sigma factor [Eubacteriales bacterium]
MTGEEFSRRVGQMTQTLYRVCRMQLSQRCDYEDAVQETLEKAWENRGRLKEERYMETWVVRILINQCHTIQRQRKRELIAEAISDPDPPPAPEGNIALHDALLALDEKQRLPIMLYYIEHYRVNEIARMLRVPQGTVKSRMASGRKELKKFYAEEELYL